MRRVTAKVLPGVRYRRYLLWRYSLIWIKPHDFPSTAENTFPGGDQHRRITFENTATALDAYRAALAAAPLSAQTARTYLSKVRGYLAWLTDASA
jgi:hypothetical protein